jgi:hypothetical protein
MVFLTFCAASSQALMFYWVYWDRFENKGLWFGGIFFVLLTGTTVTVSLIVYLRKVISLRSDPVEVAKQFFARAGFQRVEAVSRDVLLLHPRDDPMDLCVLMSDD